VKRTHIKCEKETYLGGKKNISGRNICLETKKRSIFVNYVGGGENDMYGKKNIFEMTYVWN
jgi:hypothetical protein